MSRSRCGFIAYKSIAHVIFASFEADCQRQPITALGQWLSEAHCLLQVGHSHVPVMFAHCQCCIGPGEVGSTVLTVRVGQAGGQVLLQCPIVRSLPACSMTQEGRPHTPTALHCSPASASPAPHLCSYYRQFAARLCVLISTDSSALHALNARKGSGHAVPRQRSSKFSPNPGWRHSRTVLSLSQLH